MYALLALIACSQAMRRSPSEPIESMVFAAVLDSMAHDPAAPRDVDPTLLPANGDLLTPLSARLPQDTEDEREHRARAVLHAGLRIGRAVIPVHCAGTLLPDIPTDRHSGCPQSPSIVAITALSRPEGNDAARRVTRVSFLSTTRGGFTVQNLDYITELRAGAWRVVRVDYRGTVE